MEDNNWLKKELKNIETVRKQMHDNYNTLEPPKDINDIKHILNADLDYTPKEGQTWESYIQELTTHVQYSSKKNAKAHINGPRGPWYTHKGATCFMCEDQNLIHAMLNVMRLMASSSPKNIF